MRKIFLVCVLFLISTIFVNAQEEKSKLIKRVEYDSKELGLTNKFEIHKLEDKKILTVSSQYEDKEYTYLFSKLDQNLGELSSQRFKVSKKYYYGASYKTKTHFFVFFQTRKGKYILMSINISSMEVNSVEGEIGKKISFGKMNVIGDYVFFDSRAKRETFLTKINWVNGKKKIIPVTVKENKAKSIRYTNSQVLKDESELFYFIRADKERETYVMRIGEDGEKKDFFSLTEKYDEVIADISVSKVGEDEYIYTGTYSSKSAYSSSGLFIGKSKGSNVKFIENYNFLNLNNFLNHLKERKVKKIERKKKRKEKKGKELSYNYNIACHDILKKGDKYIFIGEAYYPTYRTETTYITNADGTTTPRTRTVFDGYQYTHAIIASFDESGQLLWDNSFELYSAYKPYYEKQFISVSEASDEEVEMIFSSGRNINFKTVNQFNGKTIKERKSEIISTGDDTDKLKWIATSETDYWYGDYFITYGFQKIKNKTGKKKKKRKVYFINKIEF